MRHWIKALVEQAAVWLVQVKSWRVWAPLLIGLIAGLLVGGLAVPAQTSTSSPSQNITSGWPGLILGAFLGVVVALGFEWLSKVAGQIAARRPLNKVLGPLARELTTIYVAPFKRPLDSPLLRLDPTSSSIEGTPVVGTDLVVGWWDTVALSFIYATLLKAGKEPSSISINQNPTLDRGQWGKNLVSIGAANAKTREVLESFQNHSYTFDDEFSSIRRNPKPEDVVTPHNKRDGTPVELHYQPRVVCNGNKDYGLILKLRDEARDEGNRIFIVAGLGGDGTAGAAFYLWRNYEKLVAKGDTFSVLIETVAGYESAHEVEFDKVAILRQVK